MTNTNPSRFRRRAVTAAAIVAVLAGGAGVANAAIRPAATDSASSTATATALVEQTDTIDARRTDDPTTDDSTTDTPDDEADRPASTEEVLTGEVADKVTAAALEAVPGGTIERVETDDDGAAYEAHMTDADGNPVTVTFDDSFAVVEIQEGGPGGGHEGHGARWHGGGRGGHGGGEGEEALTGDVATQVTAAAEAAVPGGTVERVETDADGAAYEAHMTDADGNRVTVTFDDSFAVVEIQEGH